MVGTYYRIDLPYLQREERVKRKRKVRQFYNQLKQKSLITLNHSGSFIIEIFSASSAIVHFVVALVLLRGYWLLSTASALLQVNSNKKYSWFHLFYTQTKNFDHSRYISYQRKVKINMKFCKINCDNVEYAVDQMGHNTLNTNRFD